MEDLQSILAIRVLLLHGAQHGFCKYNRHFQSMIQPGYNPLPHFGMQPIRRLLHAQKRVQIQHHFDKFGYIMSTIPV